MSLVAKRGDANTSVGLLAVVFITLVTAPASVPKSLVHRVTMVEPEGRQTPEKGAQVPVPKARATVVGPPLRGGNWLAVNTPHNLDGHRSSVLRIDGREPVAQRFAIDFARVGPDAQTWRGTRLENPSYHGYGAEILAVADGVVSAIREGIPENVPSSDSRAVEITLETVLGNHVVVDSGEAKYCFYGHMQPGSIRVEPGGEVRRGDVLGLLGNSGNSTEPHLHFHIGDASSPLGAEGLPYVFDSFNAQDLGERMLGLPLERAVVAFP